MTSNSPTNSPQTSDEAISSEDEELSSNRRRRFCIERKQQLVPTTSKPKRPRIDSERSRHPDFRPSGKRRRETTGEHRRSSVPAVTKPLIKEQPKGPVIFINPMFVKRFIAKSLNLASISSKTINSSASSATTSAEGTTAATPSVAPLAGKMIEDIDFKTSPRESLQAASTMAIIRLVTECIEDDNKRDEKLNKILVTRLIGCLLHHGESEGLETPQDANSRTASGQTISGYNSEISEDDVDETGSSGRPIPVIGGSVSHHFKKNISSNFYPPLKQRHNPYPRPKRSSVSDRNSTRSSESNKSKLRNFS